MRQPVSSVIEFLESRLLLSESASAQITLVTTTGSSTSPTYNYTITLKNTGTTPIGTFWFSWVPGEDLLPSVPLYAWSPSGWGSPDGLSSTPTLTGSGNSTDGSGIEWVAQTAGAALQPGQSLAGFSFASPDSPSALIGQSPSHPGELVLTSFVYSGAPFSDTGDQFVIGGLGSTSPTSMPGVFAPKILKSTLPKTLTPGATTTSKVDVRVENQSTAATKSTVTVGIYATIGGSIASSSILLGTYSHAESLGAGKSTTLAVPITSIPSSLSVGMYTLVAHAVDASSNYSDSPAGPAINVSIPNLALSETFAKVAVPSNVTAGQKIRGDVKLDIVDNGNIADTGSTTVGIYLSTSGAVDTTATGIITESRNLKLDAGKSTFLTLPIKLIPTVAAGSYYVIAQVTDPNGDISSTNSGTQLTVAAAS